MAACLRSRFLAMSRSIPFSSASTSLNAVATARCSNNGGTGTSIRRNLSPLIFGMLPEEPAATAMKKRLPFALFA